MDKEVSQLHKENCGSWKSFFDSKLDKYGGEVILTGNLDPKDSRNIINVSDPIFKEILEIWSEANYEERIVSDYHFRSSPIGQNAWTSLIIHNPRSGKFKCESAHNKRRKDSNWRSTVDKTCIAAL